MGFWERQIKEIIRTRLWALANETPTDLQAVFSSGTPSPMYETVIRYFRDHPADWDWFFQHKEFLCEKLNDYLNLTHYELVGRILQWFIGRRKGKTQKKSLSEETIERINKQIYNDFYDHRVKLKR